MISNVLQMIGEFLHKVGDFMADKLASVPPLLVLVTSWAGLINWQKWFYAVSIIWILIQAYFRLRKEWGKLKAKREALPVPEDTDLGTLPGKLR